MFGPFWREEYETGKTAPRKTVPAAELADLLRADGLCRDEEEIALQAKVAKALGGGILIGGTCYEVKA
jgi:hypothetical protein